MALLQRTRILPQQRIDLPDYNNIEDFICADLKAIFKNAWTNQNFVLSGFEPTGTSVGSDTLGIVLAGATAIIGEDDGVMYIGAPSLANLETDALTPSATNYVEITVDQDTGGADSRAFWDQTAAGGQGAEFSQIVDTFTFIKADFAINSSGFTGDADKVALMEVDVDGGGIITAIRDARNSLFRLGRRGDANFEFSWASRVEPPTTQFDGADKDIANLKQWMDAVMSRILEVSGGSYWYSDVGVSLAAGFRNTALSVVTGIGSNAKWAWDGSNLSITDDAASPTSTDVIASVRLFDSIVDLDLTRQNSGKETVTITLDDVADSGTLTLDQDSNLIAIDFDDDTATMQATWNGSGAAAATLSGSIAEQKITIIFNAAGNQVDVSTNANTLQAGVTAVGETISIQQGQATDESIAIADGEVLWVELPDPLADTTYDDTGLTSTNYRISARGSVPNDDTTFWLAYREGANLYTRDQGELEPGETSEISDNVNQNILNILGVATETSDPNYTSTNVITQGNNIVGGMSQLDAAVGVASTGATQDRSLKLIEGGTWSVVDNAGTIEVTLSADAYIQIPGLTNVRNTIQAATISLPNANSAAYVQVNRSTGGATNLTVTVADIDAIVPDADTIIITRRVAAGALVGTASFLLKAGEYLELDGALAEVNRQLGQLKLNAHESDNDKARITAADVTLLDGNTLSQVIGDFILNFDGAVIDFTTGEVFESDGSTPLGNDFTPFTIPVGEYFWYGVSLLPGTITADNRQLATIQVDLASAADAVQADAPKPVISGDVKRGIIQVQNNAGSIEVADIRRLGTGVGGSGSGGGSARDAYEDRLSSSVFNLVSATVFREDQDDFVDGASTGSYSPADRAFKLASIGQTMVDVNNALDADFLTSELDITETELYLRWKEGAVDTLATYEVSRNGGNEWQTVTMTQVGSTNAFRGYHIFDEEAAKLNLDAQLTPDATRTLTDTGADQSIAVPFTPASVRAMQEVDVEFNKLGSPTGTYKVQLIKDDTGAPSTDPLDIVSESAQLNVADVAVGNDTVTVDISDKVLLSGDTYWLVVSTDAGYKGSYSAATHELRVRVDSSSPVADGASFNGTAWSATAGEAWAFQSKGREIDLRVRVTGGTVDALLEGYGVYYEQAPGISVADGKLEIDEFIFSGDLNRTDFTLVNISNPHPDLLEVKDVFRGQEYIAREGVCRIDGQTVTFDPDFFDDPGESIHLVFKQLKAGVIDNSDANANAIATINSQLVDIGDQLESVSDSMVLAKIAAPFTTVQNRALMPDLSSDLKPRMGIDRIMTQEIFEIQDEQGPNGEPVFGAVNDKFNQIRFIGPWTSINSSTGTYAAGTTIAVDHSVEITFYGTGLNWITFHGNDADIRATIDGGAEGADLYTTGSTVLSGRNYGTNQVIPVASGLALGLHTIKLRNNTAASVHAHLVMGFEILNEPTDIQLPPGAQLFKGRRLTKATGSTTPYNSDFETGTLGTRGGHVLVYQKADGTVAKAVTPTDGTQANLGAANHANEEIIRRINFREFGAGRTDDFSSLTSTSDRAFTLDDGTTTLVGNDVSVTSSPTREGVYGTNTSSAEGPTITFIGTGLDIQTSASDTLLREYDVYVDGIFLGAQIQSTSTEQVVRKIVSGLPYGTHTVRFERAGGISGFLIHDFIIYGPKTPALPANSKAISDYFVMADFVANTVAGIETVSTGALRKFITREMVYVNGTGGTIDWSLGSINPVNHIGALAANTNRGSAYNEYTFFGTGFDLRYEAFSNRSNDIQVFANGTPLTAANFPTAAFSTYGGTTSYNSGTGELNQIDAGVIAGAGFVCSGLPLNTYTIRFNNQTASTYLVMESLDIITPIHTPKLNGPQVIQSALDVGSQGIRDLRKFSRKDATKIPNISRCVGVVSSPGIAAPYAMTPMPDMQTAIKTEGGPIEIEFSGNISSNSASSTDIRLTVDGKNASQLLQQGVGSGWNIPISHKAIVSVAPGFHKIAVTWATTVSASSLQTRRTLTVKELKKD